MIIAQLVKSNNLTKINLSMINKYINLQYYIIFNNVIY